MDGLPTLCPSAFRSPAGQPQQAPLSETMTTDRSCQEWGRNVGLEEENLVRWEEMMGRERDAVDLW